MCRMNDVDIWKFKSLFFYFSLKEIKPKFVNTYYPRGIFRCRKKRDKLNRRQCLKVVC